jgi:hypothetical protein
MKTTVHTYMIGSLLCALAVCSNNAFSQKYDPGIMSTVNLLFDGMRAGDSTMLRKAFLPACTLTSISKNAADSVVVRKSDIAGFIKAVGTPHQEKWDEKIYNVKISVDGPMAIVWAPYKFHLGEKFSHCGVNVFTLIQTKAGWKISEITDTRRKDVCP